MAALGLTFTLLGCATTSRDLHGPLEVASIAKVQSQQPRQSRTPRSVTELLKEAQSEFEKANTAQEQGDRDAALKHYSRMLELMADADLDPGVFYNLRSEFQRILENNGKQPAQGAPSELLAAELGLEVPPPDRVLVELEEIQSVYPKNFQAGLDRSYKYVPYIQEEFSKAGLPSDLAWLAMVESLFQPKIVSRAKAAGMWQFIAATGRRHGLRIDSYVDERYNWRKATHAAVSYLTKLHDQFGSWPLAVSAYNMGEGGLDRAIASNGGETDIWRLIDSSDRMKDETKKYYPRLLASIMVAKDPERYGFKANPQPPEQTVLIPIKGSYSLAALDKACNLPQGTLRQLNPDLIRGVTPPSGEYAISVPAEAGDTLQAALQDIPQAKAQLFGSKKAYHTVKRGETLSIIAKKYDVSVEELMKANRISSATRLISGKKLAIPGLADDDEADQPETETQQEESAGSEQKTASESPRKTSGKAQNKGRVYTVRKGDTLCDIAKANNLSVKELMAINKRKTVNISVGDKLLLAPLTDLGEPDPTSREFDGEETTHTVQSGEYPGKIAKLYGVKLDDLLEWNNLSKKSTVNVGDKLVLRGIRKADEAPAVETEEKAVEAKEAVHIVAKGETAGSIAAKYNMPVSEFLAANNLTAKSIVRVGDKYKVRAAETPEETVAEPAAENKEKATAEAKHKPAEKPAEKAAKPAAGNDDVVHIVAKGETAGSIAAKYNMPVSEFLAANNLTAKSVVHVGDKYKVRVAGTPKEASAAPPAEKKDNPVAKTEEKTGEKIVHTVGKGENPTTIARRYGVKISELYEWNNWDKGTVLQVGQKVTVLKK